MNGGRADGVKLVVACSGFEGDEQDAIVSGWGSSFAFTPISQTFYSQQEAQVQILGGFMPI